MQKQLVFSFIFLLLFFLPARIFAADYSITSVKAAKTKLVRGETFAGQVTVDKVNEDTITNLVINGKEYFGSSGGGACRSDKTTIGLSPTPFNGNTVTGSKKETVLFLGWIKGSNPPVAVIGCTLPKDTPKNAQIELIAYQFRNCEDGSNRCGLIKSTQTFTVDEENSNDPTSDSSQEIAERIAGQKNNVLKDLLVRIFGGSTDQSPQNPEPSPVDTLGGTSPVPTGNQDASTVVLPASVEKLTSCIAQRQGYDENAQKHIGYILAETAKREVSIPQTAYILATARHETSFVHLSELGGNEYLSMYNGRSDLCNVVSNDGPRFKGRGYVQLTGRCNYTKFTNKLLRTQDVNYPANKNALDGVLARYVNVDYSDALTKKENLLNVPDSIINDLSGAAAIIVKGMREGLFTGKKLDDYIGNGNKNYTEARRIVNGMDKASIFAATAVAFEQSLIACNSN